MKRNSRAHQILKNAGAIDEESDNTDVIENTPDASPEHGEQAAIPKVYLFPHLEGDNKQIDATLIHHRANEFNEINIETSVSSVTHTLVDEVGEISINAAPVYTPLTTRQVYVIDERNIIGSDYLPLTHKQTCEIGETSIEAPAYSPLTPRQIFHIGERSIEVPDFSPLPSIIYPPAGKSTDNPPLSPLSSPIPDMSPATSTLFNTLIEEQDNDDFSADTYYEVGYNMPSNNSSDECRNSQIDKRNNKEKCISSDSPSILPEEPTKNSEERDNEKDENSRPKKRKVRDPSTWKINIEKRKRMKGEPYKTKKGKLIQGKPIKLAKCSTLPKHKCLSYVPEDERFKIYTEFRNMASLQEQRHFIVSHVTKMKKNRDTTQGNSRRKFTLIYTLTVADEKKVVCREFFLDTLNITGGFVKGALKKLNPEGLLLPDKRGKKAPANKLNSADEKFIHDHILCFPAVESHYCRRNSVIRYLDSALNITTMYRDYKNLCQNKSVKVVCFEKYRTIFRTYKLSFHKPKKDLCKQCIAYKEMNDEDKIKNKDSYELHLFRKTEARKCRDEDKEEAQNNNETLSFNFDLEAVLNTPKGATGPFFYVRKLAVYNLTIYNLGNQNVECYMWDETQGKRGTVEISTCINTYIASNNNIKIVKMMSDGCGGQQKNYHFASMCLMTVKQHPTLQIIDHKFFETGHTHMECDSIHSKIELKSKNVPVYTPDGWAQLVRLARTNPRPFNVTTLMYDDFKDFGLQNQYQAKVSHEGRKIGINDAVWLQYRKESPDNIFLKHNYCKLEPFIALELKKKRGKSPSYPIAAYKERFKVSSVKKKDLLKLCTDLQIPRLYHEFYKNLPSSEMIRDSLPEPDADESE